jgi:hypothetical protein
MRGILVSCCKDNSMNGIEGRAYGDIKVFGNGKSHIDNTFQQDAE